MEVRKHRSWSERKKIIKEIISGKSDEDILADGLSKSEIIFFRARAERLLELAAKKTSNFKSYYEIPIRKPFNRVVVISILFAATFIFIAFLFLENAQSFNTAPIVAACVTIAVISLGWSISGWIGHRNTIRQNTNNLISSRFSQATFGEAMRDFHLEFQLNTNSQVTVEKIRELRLSGQENGRRASASVNYLLNYYEFISLGVINGDLDYEIITKNIRGVICYYYDKCEPYIIACNRDNSKVFEHLIKMRAHYRAP